MKSNEEKILSLRKTAQALRDNLGDVIFGKPKVIDFILTALFSEGNILLEDVPGVGKTTLAKSLAKSLEADFNRIQFTPDLLPADILGGSIYNPQSGEFSFRRGPIFTHILLADEINRASPRTQSALLEAMTEKQVTIEGVCHRLQPPFIVIATQNPIEFHGTFPLPESQLDRFAMLLDIGYPSQENELAILSSQRGGHPLTSLPTVATCEALIKIQEHVRQIEVEESVARYIISLARLTRENVHLDLGISPRASLMLYRASQSLAFLENRDYVVPDDIKKLAVPVLGHRLILSSKAKHNGLEAPAIIHEILNALPVPI